MEAALITGHSDISGTLLALNRSVTTDRAPDPFTDSLDHLKALELEATVMLAVTWQRRNGDSGDQEYEPSFPEACRGKTLPELQNLLARTAADNRRREEASDSLGIPLAFTALCREWGLDRFERTVLMLLLMLNAAPDFGATYRDCDLGNGKNGIEIGTLLAIICHDLRDQLACRHYFSVEATLIRNDLIIIRGDLDDSSNILEETVSVQERLVRHLLGDNNLYSTCFRWIKREKSRVSLDQVILPGSIKSELVHCISRYLAHRDERSSSGIDDFYGYGTALVCLFHGPSGTGKTMMAQALAARFDRTIFSLTADDMREMPGSYLEIISTLFREASLQNGIVFFDECDDIFEAGTRASRSLLIELEKARCVVILATNRPVEMDPALERRISMKTYFSIPEADVRRHIWQALLPPEVSLAPDIDLDEFARRYRFTGGLIRNTIFLAVTAARTVAGAPVTITAERLHFAAGKQTATIADERNICAITIPTAHLEQLPLQQEQKQRLKNLAPVWRQLKERSMGLSIILTASDLTIAEQTAQGIARECGMAVHSFDLQQILSRSQDDRITDPVTQRRVYPLEYAFAPSAGDEAMILFIDRDNLLKDMLSGRDEKSVAHIYLSELLQQLRGFTGLFCLIGRDCGDLTLPPELNLHERLKLPDRHTQTARWQQLLPDTSAAAITRITTEYPLHLSEIDFIVRQASIQAAIARMAAQPDLNDVRQVLARLMGTTTTPLLFGGAVEEGS